VDIGSAFVEKRSTLTGQDSNKLNDQKLLRRLSGVGTDHRFWMSHRLWRFTFFCIRQAFLQTDDKREWTQGLWTRRRYGVPCKEMRQAKSQFYSL